MKAILIGIVLIALGVIEMIFVQDATAFIFFAPLGAFMIVNGIKYGDRCLKEEFWED